MGSWCRCVNRNNILRWKILCRNRNPILLGNRLCQCVIAHGKEIIDLALGATATTRTAAGGHRSWCRGNRIGGTSNRYACHICRGYSPGSCRNRTSLTRRLCEGGHTIRVSIMKSCGECERTVGRYGQIVPGVVLEYHCATQARNVSANRVCRQYCIRWCHRIRGR